MATEMSSGYKPLLFTTTVRNPERIKKYLYVLGRFEGQMLTNDLCVAICAEAIRVGLYRPLKKRLPSVRSKWKSSDAGDFADYVLSAYEVTWMLKNNPQNHKEAGFDYGWPSRFQTQFMITRQLGFAYYEIGQKIEVSELGRKLIKQLTLTEEGEILAVEEGDGSVEQEIFMHAMVKYHRDNPYLKVLNRNCPIVLLLRVIRLINADSRYNNCGLTRREILLLLFWKDNNANAVYDMIVDLRTKYGYTPSKEVLLDYCFKKILGEKPKVFDDDSLIKDYIDGYIRYMRLTGLVTLRGAGRFIDINHLMDARIDYVITNYFDYVTFTDRRKYFEYVSTVDKGLLSLHEKATTGDMRYEYLSKWKDTYRWPQLKNELCILAKKKSSADNVLKFLDGPKRLEFLAALAVLVRRPKYKVCPNYKCDDEGLPTSTATGNQGDIECYCDDDNVLVEVTLHEGTCQTKNEGWPVGRHLTEFAIKHSPASCIFVAPSIFTDTVSQFEWTENKTGHATVAMTIDELVRALDVDTESLSK